MGWLGIGIAASGKAAHIITKGITMHILPILNINFGVRVTPKIRDYGDRKVIQETGIINNKKLDIYYAYNQDKKLEHKLFYLSDLVGNWIKSKLQYFNKDGKVIKSLHSENTKKKGENT